MIFISYSEWRAIEVERLTALSERVECKSCEGKGEKDCHCSCGHTHEAECQECDGAGSLIFKDLSTSLANKLYVGIEHYEKAVLEDAQQLAGWVAKNVFEVLVESGFQPWMSKWKSSGQIYLLPPESRRAAA